MTKLHTNRALVYDTANDFSVVIGSAGTGASGGTTGVNSTSTVSRHSRLSAVATATTTGKATQYDMSANAAGNLASLVQPDVPRNVVLTITDANASVSALQVTITGTKADGTADTEVLTKGGTLTLTGSKAWAHITTVHVDSSTGGAAGDALDMGYGLKLGLAGVPSGTVYAVYKENVDNVDETVGTVDATNGTVITTSAPNGSKNFDVWYTVTQPAITQSSHTHTGPSHNHSATVS